MRLLSRLYVPIRLVSQKMSDLLLPPDSVRGMTQLDRAKFTKDIQVPCLRVTVPLLSTSPVLLTAVKQQSLKMPKFKSFQPDPTGENYKVVYFNPNLVKKWDDLDADARDLLTTNGMSAADLVWKTVSLSWDNFVPQQILHAIVGESAPNVTGFSIVGHIVHLNLRPEHDAFKEVIGELIDWLVWIEDVTCR